MSTFNLLSYGETSNTVAFSPAVNPLARKKKKISTVLFWTSLVLALSASFVFGLISAGEEGVILTIAALLPFSFLIFLGLLLASRAEVPLGTRLLALIWGGAGSTTLTFIIIDTQNALFGPSESMDSVVIQAAVVEESAKAILLFGFLWLARSYIKTPLAGAVLGIMVGAGFAYVENILYFSAAYQSGGWAGFWVTFIMRAGMSFFLHAMATMFTGLFIGFIVSHNFSWWKNSLITSGGLLAAMTIHGLWNGSASLSTVSSNWNMMYLFFWLPLVAVIVTTLVIVSKNYTSKRKALLAAMVENGIIREQQAERMSARKTRKKVYRQNKSKNVLLWERSLTLADFWKTEIQNLPSKPRYDKKHVKYAKKRDEAFTHLASVIDAV